VGKRRLEKAISQLDSTKVTVKVEWKPFFLVPDMEDKSVNKRLYYDMKFGKARVDRMIPYMKQVGQQDGINFSYGGNVGPTMRSHRLLELAKEKDPSLKLQDKVVNTLFALYFENEGDISDRATLASAAKSAGLFDSVEDARAFLDSDARTNEVKAGVQEAYSTRISGVPFFRLPGGVGVSGAQETSYFVQQFKKMGLPFKS